MIAVDTDLKPSFQDESREVSQLTETNLPPVTPDPLYSLRSAYRADSNPKKIDLVIGAYRDENGKPWTLPVVQKAKQIIHDDLGIDHEYLPIPGLSSFIAASQSLILGKSSPAIQNDLVVSFQTLSGTGAVHLGALFLSKYYPFPTSQRTILLPSPTWDNHKSILKTVDLEPSFYTYLNRETSSLDIAAFLSDLQALPSRSIILLHTCAHNPTGVDPTRTQWQQIAAIMLEKQHFPFFDCAYQGFASGDLDADAYPIRLFQSMGFEMVIAQSYAKNMGLYGERTGALHYILSPLSTNSKRVAIQSALSTLQRATISNPPSFGARLVSTILNTPALYDEWLTDLKTMSTRIQRMRVELQLRLETTTPDHDWRFINQQIGMFSYFTVLSPELVSALRHRFAVYMTESGRISMAGLNEHNLQDFADAVCTVIREVK